MILLSHPTVHSSACHVARALKRAGVLGEFWTCRETLRRPPSRSSDALDAIHVAPASRAETPGVSSEVLCRSLDQDVSARLATDLFQGVYAFEGSAEASFRTAGDHGLLRCYDLPAGHWRAEQLAAEEEAAREPEWAPTLGLRPPDEHLTARKDAELAQADVVFVGSTFLLKTLDHAATPHATIATLNPGALRRSLTLPRPALSPAARTREKLRALFVGPLNQHQGLSYLFRACRELQSEVSLTVVSPPPAASCSALDRELRDVQWQPTATTAGIRAAMSTHDVLLAPSLFDGFSTVIPEALASGLPVIATPHTAAPDLVADQVEGFIVSVRSAEEIVARLALLRREPDLLAQMSVNARRRAARQTWEDYESALAATVVTALSHR